MALPPALAAIHQMPLRRLLRLDPPRVGQVLTPTEWAELLVACIEHPQLQPWRCAPA